MANQTFVSRGEITCSLPSKLPTLRSRLIYRDLLSRKKKKKKKEFVHPAPRAFHQSRPARYADMCHAKNSQEKKKKKSLRLGVIYSS